MTHLLTGLLLISAVAACNSGNSSEKGGSEKSGKEAQLYCFHDRSQTSAELRTCLRTEEHCKSLYGSVIAADDQAEANAGECKPQSGLWCVEKPMLLGKKEMFSCATTREACDGEFEDPCVGL